jgi:tetraacyldisaccharide 4'-kinase
LNPASLRERLEAVWYRGDPVPWWLDALERIYRALFELRRHCYALGLKRSERLAVPVVVVGNISVGGTGKTPLVIWLARELRERGWNPGVILRGYGGDTRSALRVTPAMPASRCGDEALLIARALNVPVATAARRAAAGRLLVSQAGCDVIIADDGLQHWALARDLELAVIDAARGFGNARLLPAGPLREPIERLARVDYVVVNGEGEVGAIPSPRSAGAAGATLRMRLLGRSAVSLSRPGEVRPLDEFAGRRVHAAAGIGNPERFFRLLEGHRLVPVRHPFPDHHRITPADLEFGDGLPVFITEKDAVKLTATSAGDVWMVPVEVDLPGPLANAVHERLHALRGQ